MRRRPLKRTAPPDTYLTDMSSSFYSVTPVSRYHSTVVVGLVRSHSPEVLGRGLETVGVWLQVVGRCVQQRVGVGALVFDPRRSRG